MSPNLPRALWQSHLKLHENKDGAAQAYAHVEATMARLPFACSLGKESLLQTLVESNVPVKVRSQGMKAVKYVKRT